MVALTWSEAGDDIGYLTVRYVERKPDPTL